MSTIIHKYWQVLTRKAAPEQRDEVANVLDAPSQGKTREVEIAPNDPLLTFLLSAPGVVQIDKLDMDSPALRALKEGGVSVVVPLVSQGELIGMLNLGPRLSEQEYSTYDFRLLTNLATQAAPALRVAQLVQQQRLEARERERYEQELRVARVIQQTLLPKDLPSLPGWDVAAHWQPARAVSGDFYDFIVFPDGKLGFFAGDVTDKGVPAALVMATTRSVLRTAAEQLVWPSQVLERVNNLLSPDIPENMFVTCLYAVLEPQTGKLRFANAGHNLPYQRTAQGVVELRATGMPLGLMPDMTYEEKETVLAPGENIILYSDGLVEAHNPRGEMYGFPRLHELVSQKTTSGLKADSGDLIQCLLDSLVEFTGPDWEQEDDVTFVIVERLGQVLSGADEGAASSPEAAPDAEWRLLSEFSLPSEPGNERLAMDQVVAAVKELGLSNATIERLKTAVAEATMNAMEHGNHYQVELPVILKVLASPRQVAVKITDQSGDQPIPEHTDPDLEAKLAGLQSPRGWGLFLIQNMVDEMHVHTDQQHHTVELILYLKGEQDDSISVPG